jgi:DNA-binding SARP family transcriptional activator
MQPNPITEFNGQSIADQIEDKAVILLAPRYDHRNAILPSILQSDAQAYLYTLKSEDKTLPVFLSNLVNSLSDFDPKFGAQTTQALQQRRVSPQDLADALLADLGKAKPKPHFLVLDEFDHLIPDEQVSVFFQRFVEGLSKGLQLVINSRLLTYEPWSSFVRSGTAVVLGETEVLDGGIFNPDIPEMSHLEVYGFRAGQVFVNGLPVETWDGPLPRNLFYYFIDHPMITRDEIFETFWPDLPIKEATNVFHVTKRKVSERLGHELTNYSGGFYRPSDQISIHYDVASFEAAVSEGSGIQAPQTPDVWYKAIQLYRSEFLHKIEMPWVSQRREQLRLKYADALIGVGRLHKSLGDSERAISYYLRALREVPQREDIHRDVMTLYETRGERQKAIAQYKMLTDILKRTLNITPSKSTRTLYDLLSEG